MPFDYPDLEGKDGSFESSPGVEQVLYFASKSDFASIVAPPDFASITDIEEAAVIDGTGSPHTFNTSKCFKKLEVVMDTGELNGETVGERGSRAIKVNFEAVYVGKDEAILGMIRTSKEDQFIILVPLANGKVLQIGTEKKPALMTMNYSTGKSGEGRKGVTIQVESTDVAIWQYNGDITTTPAA